MIGYIYKLTNEENGMIYVGQTTNPHKRWLKHKSVARGNKYIYNSYLYGAINYYGENKFKFEVIEECKLSELEDRETYWIKKLNSLAPQGYNLTSGGVALYKEKNPFYGKTHSEEAKYKISKANTGRIASNEEREMRRTINSGVNNPFYGKKHTKETIDKLKATFTEQRRSTQSEVMKKNNPNKDGRYSRKVSVAMISLETEDVLRVWDNASEAGRYLKEEGITNAKCPSNSIYDVCRGRQKSAFGYMWRYVEEGLSTIESYTHLSSVENKVSEDDTRSE